MSTQWTFKAITTTKLILWCIVILWWLYICKTIQDPTMPPSFLFHHWQIYNVTKEEHFLLAPILHFFLHRPNVLYHKKHVISQAAHLQYLSYLSDHDIKVSPFFLLLLKTGAKLSPKSFSISFTSSSCTCDGTLLVSPLRPWWAQIMLLFLLHLQKHLI